jgi:uncharacterized membrane protein
MKSKKLWQLSGIFLITTGILHTLVALMMEKNAFIAIFCNGFFNGIGTNVELGLAFWFLICGIVTVFLGQILHYYIKKEQTPAPKFLGYNLLILSVIGCCIVPVSGFWLFIPQALIIIFATK